MQVRIEDLAEKALLGKSVRMSMSKNLTVELWTDFMQNRIAITNSVNSDLFSIQVYDNTPSDFGAETEFTKWAATEVTDYDNIPKGFETYTLKGGLYAVFIHIGTSAEFENTFNYIFGKWFPQSGYALDNRAHFEVLGDKYKNNQPDSEEEVWIPIKNKS